MTQVSRWHTLGGWYNPADLVGGSLDNLDSSQLGEAVAVASASRTTAEREEALEACFLSIFSDDKSLDKFFKEFPKGLILHEHLGCHKNTVLDNACNKGFFWDKVSKELVSGKDKQRRLAKDAKSFIPIQHPLQTKYREVETAFIRSTTPPLPEAERPQRENPSERRLAPELKRMKSARVLSPQPNRENMPRQNLKRSAGTIDLFGEGDRNLMEFASKTNFFWSREAMCLFSEQEKEKYLSLSAKRFIAVEKLKLTGVKYQKAAKAFSKSITQPAFSKWKGKEKGRAFKANQHFHKTFVITGLVNVNHSECYAEEYLNAKRENLTGSHVMVDLPLWEAYPSSVLKGLTDSALEEFTKTIKEWADKEAEKCQIKLTQDEKSARERLKVDTNIFESDGPIILSILAEIGKAHSLECKDPDLFMLLSRFACDVFKAHLLMEKCPFVKTINCVGPEYLTKELEPLEATILDFYFRRSERKKQISYHCGELVAEIASSTQMTKRVDLVVSKCHAKRIGHGTCIKDDDELKKLKEEDVAIEVCPSACELLLGVSHPFYRFIKNGIPIVVSTDNRNVFETTQSDEFMILAKQWKGIKYADIRSLARNSIHYSDLEGESIFDRAEGFFVLKMAFASFIDGEAPLEGEEAFRSLSEKQKYQIRLERKLFDFENEMLKEGGRNTHVINTLRNKKIALKKRLR